jgi:hypothetical protein
MPSYLSLSAKKFTACRELFAFAGRIGTLLDSQKVQSCTSMQASLDDFLGAVYSLIYARNHDYDDRQQALGQSEMRSVHIRATDMGTGKVRVEGKWTAGFYFNNALFRISAIYHRALKIVANKEAKRDWADTLRPVAESLFQSWENRLWTNTSLVNLHKEVNDLKHTASGNYHGREVKFPEAVSALNELLNLIEAWAKSGA